MDERYKKIITTIWSQAFSSGSVKAGFVAGHLDPMSMGDVSSTLDSSVDLCGGGLTTTDGDAKAKLSQLKVYNMSLLAHGGDPTFGSLSTPALSMGVTASFAEPQTRPVDRPHGGPVVFDEPVDLITLPMALDTIKVTGHYHFEQKCKALFLIPEGSVKRDGTFTFTQKAGAITVQARVKPDADGVPTVKVTLVSVGFSGDYKLTYDDGQSEWVRALGNYLTHQEGVYRPLRDCALRAVSSEPLKSKLQDILNTEIKRLMGS